MNKYRKTMPLFLVVSLIIVGCSGTPTESFDDQVETVVVSTLVAYTPKVLKSRSRIFLP